MAKINVLSFEIANLIAAGEVVERPSSVLKELIENSIDSGATEIVAEIKRGGVALIRVTDNGCGIEKEDLPVAIQRHATSKIKERDDLESIMTLGFRGEALAAISSVSNMTIITKTRDAEVGYMLTAEGGKVVDIAEVGAADGTTVVVSDLFYNVPARRKFLKKDATEAMNVAALVEKVALSRPDISIQLLIDGEEKFKTPGDGNLLNTIYAVLGKAFASKLIEAKGTANGMTVSGYIGRSDNVKKNRNLMNVFINGRYVKSLTAQAAIEKAYTSYIAPECFPTCVLFIEINPALVDVNVHPAKLEVKFSDERAVFETVYYTVKSALEEHEYRPEMELGAKRPSDNIIGGFIPVDGGKRAEQYTMSTPTATRNEPKATYAPPKEGYKPSSRGAGGFVDPSRPVKVASTSEKQSSPVSHPEPVRLTPKDSVELLERYGSSAPTASKAMLEQEEKAVPPKPIYKLIGEAFDCYVIVEFEGDLLIIDKHAAHERVIFEDLKRGRESDGYVSSQPLMLPITVILDHEELVAASELKEEIQALGFEYNVLDRSCDILAIPSLVSPADAETLFVQLLDEAIEGRGNPTITDSIRREKALYQVACKAAIKGGRVYTSAVITWLVEKVLSLPDITVCPHGRPIAYKLTKNQLDRQFDRIK